MKKRLALGGFGRREGEISFFARGKEDEGEWQEGKRKLI